MKSCALLIIIRSTLLALVALTSAPTFAALISIKPTDTQLNVGETVFVDFEINLNSNEIFSAFDINLSFEHSAFAFLSASFIDPWTSVNQLDLPELDSFGFFGDAFDRGDGVLDVFGVSGNSDGVLGANQAGNFTFARLEFLAIAEIANGVFSFDPNNPTQAFLGADFSDLSVSFQPSFAAVSVGSSVAVPEPSTAWLLLAGLPVVMSRYRRIRRESLTA